jgi:hypothetical protein
MWLGIVGGWAVGMAIAASIVLGFHLANPVAGALISGSLTCAGIGIGGMIANRIIYGRRY